MNTDKPFGLLFDLDGVLIDTESVYTSFWQAINHRFPTGVDGFEYIIKGSNLNEILPNFFPDATVQGKVVDMLNEFQRGMRYDYFAGVPEFLADINRRGIPCAVVTSSDNRKMEALAGQHPDFASHFQAIVTGDMITRAKPDPECYHLGAHLLGLEAEQCYVFEDSLNGLRAGMASGATVIGLATTLPAEEIAPYCHHIINNVYEAHALLKF